MTLITVSPAPDTSDTECTHAGTSTVCGVPPLKSQAYIPLLDSVISTMSMFCRSCSSFDASSKSCIIRSSLLSSISMFSPSRNSFRLGLKRPTFLNDAKLRCFGSTVVSIFLRCASAVTSSMMRGVMQPLS